MLIPLAKGADRWCQVDVGQETGDSQTTCLLNGLSDFRIVILAHFLENTGDFIGLGSLGESFSAPGDNFLAIKVSYWMGLR